MQRDNVYELQARSRSVACVAVHKVPGQWLMPLSADLSTDGRKGPGRFIYVVSLYAAICVLSYWCFVTEILCEGRRVYRI